MDLYTDKNPQTTTHGLGFKDAEKARRTLRKIKERDIVYQKQVVVTMYYRAKHHPHRTKDMEEAMKVFKRWMDRHGINYRKRTKSLSKKTRSQRGGGYSFLDSILIKKYEKVANEYGVSEKARGKKKPTTTDKGFLEVYRSVEGNFEKLKNMPVKKKNPNGEDWFSRRNRFIKSRLGQMRKSDDPWFYPKGHKYEGLPTKQHIILIMWAYTKPRYENKLKKLDLKKLL